MCRCSSLASHFYYYYFSPCRKNEGCQADDGSKSEFSEGAFGGIMYQKEKVAERCCFLPFPTSDDPISFGTFTVKNNISREWLKKRKGNQKRKKKFNKAQVNHRIKLRSNCFLYNFLLSPSLERSFLLNNKNCVMQKKNCSLTNPHETSNFVQLKNS